MPAEVSKEEFARVIASFEADHGMDNPSPEVVVIMAALRFAAASASSPEPETPVGTTAQIVAWLRQQAETSGRLRDESQRLADWNAANERDSAFTFAADTIEAGGHIPKAPPASRHSDGERR